MSSLKSDDEDYSYSMIVMVHDTLDVIAFIAIGTACALTLSYLNNLSLAKKCLLLYLYKDVISCCLCLRSFRMIEALLSYYDVNGTSKTLAIVLSFGLSLCVFYLCLLLIFVSVSKLYMAKSNTIDSPIPFLPKNEALAIKQIRIGCFLLAIGVLSTTFSVGWYPLSYYIMMQDQEEGTYLIYRCGILLLLSISGVLTVAKRYYETTTDLQIDQIIPKTIKCIFIFFLSTLACSIIAEATQLMETKKIVKISEIIRSIILIFGPFVMIYRSNQLKTHSIRIIKNTCDDFFLLSIYLVPTFTFMLINLCLCMFL